MGKQVTKGRKAAGPAAEPVKKVLNAGQGAGVADALGKCHEGFRVDGASVAERMVAMLTRILGDKVLSREEYDAEVFPAFLRKYGAKWSEVSQKIIRSNWFKVIEVRADLVPACAAFQRTTGEMNEKHMFRIATQLRDGASAREAAAAVNTSEKVKRAPPKTEAQAYKALAKVLDTQRKRLSKFKAVSADLARWIAEIS